MYNLLRVRAVVRDTHTPILEILCQATIVSLKSMAPLCRIPSILTRFPARPHHFPRCTVCRGTTTLVDQHVISSHHVVHCYLAHLITSHRTRVSLGFPSCTTAHMPSSDRHSFVARLLLVMVQCLYYHTVLVHHITITFAEPQHGWVPTAHRILLI
jgi:hypothetical protein